MYLFVLSALFSLFDRAPCGEITVNHPTVTAAVGSKVTLTWSVKSNENETLIWFKIVLADTETIIALAAVDFLKGTQGGKLFNNRLKVSYEKYNWYSIHITNVSYNDANTFRGIGLFEPGPTELKKSADIVLEVQGGLTIVNSPSTAAGKDAEPKSISIVLEGFPRPNVTWTLDSKQLTQATVESINNYQHKYTVTTNLTRDMNRKILKYEAKGIRANKLNGKIKINVTWGAEENGKSEFSIKNKNLTGLIKLLGNPKPVVSWKLGSRKGFIEGVEVSSDAYDYSLQTSVLLSDCGRKLQYQFRDINGREMKRDQEIKFTFKPKRVQIKNVIRIDKCVTIQWEKEDTGLCKLHYEVKFGDSTPIKVFYSHEHKDCKKRSINVTSIRAVYENQFGDWNIFAVQDVVKITPSAKPKSLILYPVLVAIIVVLCVCIIISIICTLFMRRKLHNFNEKQKSAKVETTSDNNSDCERNATNQANYPYDYVKVTGMNVKPQAEGNAPTSGNYELVGSDPSTMPMKQCAPSKAAIYNDPKQYQNTGTLLYDTPINEKDPHAEMYAKVQKPSKDKKKANSIDVYAEVKKP